MALALTPESLWQLLHVIGPATSAASKKEIACKRQAYLQRPKHYYELSDDLAREAGLKLKPLPHLMANAALKEEKRNRLGCGRGSGPLHGSRHRFWGVAAAHVHLLAYCSCCSNSARQPTGRTSSTAD
jgi:hypothetical protein